MYHLTIKKSLTICHNQTYSNTPVPTQVNASQHESTRVWHESTEVRHESTWINTSPTRVNTNQHDSSASPTRVNTNQYESNTNPDYKNRMNMAWQNPSVTFQWFFLQKNASINGFIFLQFTSSDTIKYCFFIKVFNLKSTGLL